MTNKPPLAIGSEVNVSRTISESDLYLLQPDQQSGPDRMDEEYREKNTAYGKRVVHGAYLVGLSSAASTLLGDQFDKGPYRGASTGYDRVRFIKPVFIGDTITMTYKIREIDAENLKTYADIVGTNQDGTVVFASVHIGKGAPPRSRIAP